MREPLRQYLWQSVGWTLGVTLLANCLFFALAVIAAGDFAVVSTRIRTAFETGELGIRDYLPSDSRLGWHQYNDCNVLQMLSNPEPSRIKRAIAPLIYKMDPDFNRACPVLYALMMEGEERDRLLNFRYGRYWHGNNVLAAFALHFLELKSYRKALSLLVWLAILTLALVTFRLGPHLRRTGLAIGLASASVWAVPYFAPGLTHGPGDALLLFALAGLTIYAKNIVHLNAIIPFAAGFGAVVVFFEMLTGQLPIASAWLAAITLAAGRDIRREVSRPIVVALIALIAFGVGAGLTVIVKQALAFLLAEPTTAAQFLTQLRQYVGVPASDGIWPGRILPYVRLVQKSHVLTYGNALISYALLIATLFTWLAAVSRGLQRRHSAEARDILFLAAAALIPIIWVLLWPNHTLIHADFMVRILVVPIALAPLAYFWPPEPIRSRT